LKKHPPGFKRENKGKIIVLNEIKNYICRSQKYVDAKVNSADCFSHNLFLMRTQKGSGLFSGRKRS
jgi:hypothetical protein